MILLAAVAKAVELVPKRVVVLSPKRGVVGVVVGVVVDVVVDVDVDAVEQLRGMSDQFSSRRIA